MTCYALHHLTGMTCNADEHDGPHTYSAAGHVEATWQGINGRVSWSVK